MIAQNILDSWDESLTYLEINPVNRINFDKVILRNKMVVSDSKNNAIAKFRPANNVFFCEVEQFFSYCDMKNSSSVKFDIIITESHHELAKKYLNKDGIIMDFNGNELNY